LTQQKDDMGTTMARAYQRVAINKGCGDLKNELDHNNNLHEHEI
jgi:hypothetical protein